MAKRPRTPAQKAALRKAQLASARARSLRAKSRKASLRRHYSGDPIRRGVGVAGLQKNATPYLRLNKRSATIGGNTGTIIPFTGKRIVAGGYLRIENTTRRNALDTATTKIANKIARPGTKPGAARKWFNENVTIKNPAVRANVGGAQVRLGTSRSSGLTLIVRKGKHSTPQLKSKMGVNKYNQRMRVLQRISKPKPKRRARRGR
jgi:hypothetical protein